MVKDEEVLASVPDRPLSSHRRHVSQPTRTPILEPCTWFVCDNFLLTALFCCRYTGYAHSLIGSIIANEGFIKQFATVTDPATGEPALDSQHISLWQASSFVSQIFIQLFSHLTADRYGRKFNMWAFTALLTTVSLITSASQAQCLVIRPFWR